MTRFKRRFFFVTNRQIENMVGPVKERFGNQRTENLNFGLFDTATEPTLGLGMIVNPTDWFQNEEIQIQQVQPLDQSGFVEQLRKQVQAAPNDRLVTLVDVTPVNRTRNFHNFSLETPQFYDELYLRLVNEEMPHSRPMYKVDTLSGRAYWILTQGR
jgi:hypothetical protein